ncbi:sugar transferase [Streptococcus suis]|uniref:sugar transferase n=1 Tax=Streptococcus suis TaxID=1307 RepID=UPI000CF4B44F|nr:sugar transferase [Streptococcus suis]MBY5011074.1 sugar transferase [Streptococcus suis]MCQ8268510.1 sugar transferase [Streptococcus suis]MDG4514954.1 sugar transferase [Streptococcus suis]MDG4519483.1 sugar transferase [Streptococcus suis]NQI73505.1 sugar transferase [Streptococcus suis]
MKIHITNLYGQSSRSVALIAQNMVTEIARDLDFREIGIYTYPVHTDSSGELSKRIDGMMAAVGSDDIVIVQSPSWNSTEFDDYFVTKLKVYPQLRVVIFIHDIIPLMFKSNEYLIDKTIATYNRADLLVVPSEKMLTELRRWGLTTEKVVIQHMWDHPTTIAYQRPKFQKVIQFAGSPNRFTFLKEWQYDIPLYLYAGETVENCSQVIFEGWKDDAELLQTLPKRGGFGLVWSQKSDVDYYEWNVSYKLSTYLAAGLPVIVPDTLSNQAIIRDNHLGLVVSSLDDAVEKISSLTEEDYNHMVDRVKNYRELLINGYFTKKLLIDSVHGVLSSKSL